MRANTLRGANRQTKGIQVLDVLDDIKHKQGRTFVPVDHSRDAPPHGGDVASTLTVRVSPEGKVEIVAIFDGDSRKRKFQLPGGRPTLRSGIQEPLRAAARKEEVEEAFIQPLSPELFLAAKFSKHNQTMRDSADANTGTRGDVDHFVFMRISDAQVSETTDVDAKHPCWLHLQEVFTPDMRFQLGSTLRRAPFALSHILMIAKTLWVVGMNYANYSKENLLAVASMMPNEECRRHMEFFTRMQEMAESNPAISAAFAQWADISPWEIASGFITDWELAQDLLDNIEMVPIITADWAKI